jgi:SH3-like domain-containing protein
MIVKIESRIIRFTFDVTTDDGKKYSASYVEDDALKKKEIVIWLCDEDGYLEAGQVPQTTGSIGEKIAAEVLVRVRDCKENWLRGNDEKR